MTTCPDCNQPLHPGMWPFPCAGKGHQLGSFWYGDAQVHAAQKVVVLENAKTGEVRIPGRADRPVHPKYAAEGFVRKELDTISQVRELEKKTGLIHESSNYDKNSTKAEHDTNST